MKAMMIAVLMMLHSAGMRAQNMAMTAVRQRAAEAVERFIGRSCNTMGQ